MDAASDALAGDADVSGDAATTDAGPPGPVITDWCSAIIPGLCATIFGCCDGCVQGAYGGSEAQCIANEMDRCLTKVAALQQAANLGNLMLDTAQLASCSTSLQSLSNTCDANVLGVLLDECFRAVVGVVPPGDPCVGGVVGFEWAECDEGVCIAGQCQAWLGLGADCSGAPCDVYELRCIDDGTALTCEAPLPDGAPCTLDANCSSRSCVGTCMPVAGTDVCASL